MHIEATDETIIVVVKFKIGGSLRFLSHAETLRVLQRACVRAGINLQYSRGFNPRPKMSLPLPRPVGVESDDELLTMRANRRSSLVARDSMNDIRNTTDEARIMDALSEQLPEGFELISVDFAEARAPYQPRSATYIFSVRPEFLDDELKNRINDLMASESLFVRRPIDKTKSNFKDMDVRCFISSMELEGADIVVECGVSETGSIRIQEVLELMELDMEKLASPIRRTCVQWRDV